MPSTVTKSVQWARRIVHWHCSDEDKRMAHKAERHRARQILSQQYVDDYGAEEELARTFKPRLDFCDIA